MLTHLGAYLRPTAVSCHKTLILLFRNTPGTHFLVCHTRFATTAVANQLEQFLLSVKSASKHLQNCLFLNKLGDVYTIAFFAPRIAGIASKSVRFEEDRALSIC